jgi:hypothetical protein
MVFGELLKFQDKMFLCKRRIRESHQPILKNWKIQLSCDIVLKKEGWFYFCREVEDAEIVE